MSRVRQTGRVRVGTPAGPVRGLSPRALASHPPTGEERQRRGGARATLAGAAQRQTLPVPGGSRSSRRPVGLKVGRQWNMVMTRLNGNELMEWA